MPFYQESINQHNTPLSGEDEVKYQVYKSINEPNDPGADYDYRGAWKAGIHRSLDPGSGEQHYPDTYKKPAHETFSDESIYSSLVGTRPGHWKGDTYAPMEQTTPAATPDPGIMKNALDKVSQLSQMLMKNDPNFNADEHQERELSSGPFKESEERHAIWRPTETPEPAAEYSPANLNQVDKHLQTGEAEVMLTRKLRGI